MLQFIIGGIVVLGGITIAALLEEEEKQANNWKSKHKALNNKISKHRNSLNIHIKKAKKKAAFYELNSKYYASVQGGNLLFKELTEAAVTIDKIYQVIHTMKKARNKLYLDIKMEKNSQKKKEMIELVKMMPDKINKMYIDFYKMKDEKNCTLNELREINNMTHEFKLKIRDNTGKRGREWFRRLEERKRQKLTN